MPIWQPKIRKWEQRIEDADEELRWRMRWQGPKLGAFDPDVEREAIEREEFPWIGEQSEAVRKELKLLKAEKRGKEIIGEWLMPMAAFQGLPPAMAGWRAAAPWIARGGWRKTLGYVTRGVLAPIAGAEKVVEFGFKTFIKGAETVVSTYLQKLEAHRMSRELGWSEEFYKKLAVGTTGKESMTKMTKDEAEKFMQAIVDQGGLREIVLPAERGLVKEEAKKEAQAIALELSEYLGRVKPVKEIRLGKPKKGMLEKVGETRDNYMQRTYRLERILDKIDGYPKANRYNIVGGKMSQVFYNAANSAEDAKLWGVAKTVESLRGFLLKNKADFGETFSRRVVVQGVELSTDQRLGIVAHTLHPDNLRHLMSPKGNALPKSFVQDVIASLDANEKRLVGWALKYYKDDASAVMEAYAAATGKKLREVAGTYIPIVLEKDFAVPFGDELVAEAAYRYTRKWPSSLIKKGFTKARSAKANQPMEIGLFDNLFKRLPEVEHYKAFSPTVRDWQRIMGNPSFRNAMINKTGKPTFDVLKQWVKDVAQTNPLAARDWEERLMQGLRVNAVTAVLGWNITTMLKQFPSFMIGAARLGNINAFRGLYTSIVDKVGTDALIKRLAPQIQNRVMEREIAEGRALKSFGDRIFDKKNLREIFMFLTLAMDKTVVKGLWRGAYDDGIRKGFSEKLAAEYATKMIRETQPFFSIKDLAQLWRSQGKSGELLKVLIIFQNQLNQYWNFNRHIIYGGWRAKQISTPEALKLFIEGTILPALMIGAVTRSDIARTPKEALVDIASMGFSTVPIVGQFITSGLRGYRDTGGIISTEILARAQTFAYEANKGEWAKAVMILPEFAGYLKGIPVVQPSRMIRAILDKGSGVFDDWLQLIWGTYAREEAAARSGGGGGRGGGRGGRGGGRRKPQR